MEGPRRFHSHWLSFCILEKLGSCYGWSTAVCGHKENAEETERPRAAESFFCSALLNESGLHLLFISFNGFLSTYRNPEAASYWHCGEGRNRALPLAKVAGILHETHMFLCHCLSCCPGRPGTHYIEGDCLKLRVWLWNIGIKSLCSFAWQTNPCTF